jgi:beta-galactosidase
LTPLPLLLLFAMQQPDAPTVPLPHGATAAWDLASASRESTSTRERICINGLWQWQPADSGTPIPQSQWGWFKVPGAWPGITDYMQKDCQTLFAHPAWKSTKQASVTSAWYQREITIPTSWAKRRILLTTEYVNSLAVVYVDGKPAGEIRFPAGSVDLTAYCKPGRHSLSMRVTALPLKAVMTAFTDTNNAREVMGAVARRGLCGDVYLVAEPRAERITDVKVEPSVRRKELALVVSATGLRSDRPYVFQAEILEHGNVVHRSVFPEALLRTGHPEKYRFTTHWMPRTLWDTNTPQNQFTARVSLVASSGAVLDQALPVRFGFREMWIGGRDFYLNGSRIYLQAVPLDNAQVGAAWSTYQRARESMLRLKSFGINFVYTHNYDCEPGSHLSFEEILRAADDVGMLVALTQPHFSAYDWRAPDADSTNGYVRHAQFYVHVAQNHPSVIAYAMSHNATSYDEAKNPDMMDGRVEPRDSWAMNNARKALRAEAIVKRLDPTRIVYHHSSGSLGAMYTENFYVNFAPIQELSDWFEKWSTHGLRPMFLCEYGVPFSWDWTMYRGWFNGKREWGSAEVPWELCVAEWNAQFMGDRAYNISEREKQDLRWEAQQFRSGREGWHRWDYPTPVGSSAFSECSEVFAAYIKDNWRAYRTWGVSAFSPWEYEVYWQTRPGLDRKRKDLPVDWAQLQRPGFSPDYVDSQYETMNLAYGRDDWIPSVAAQALMRNNRPLLAYIGGKPSRFTCKDHNFVPGDTVEKQLIVINNSREPVSCSCTWTLNLPTAVNGSVTTRVLTGNQARLPLRIPITATTPPGRFTLTARFSFSTGEVQTDTLDIDVLAPHPQPKLSVRIACFDPKGETTALLTRLGVHVEPVTVDSDLTPYGLLVIGNQAITLTNLIPDLRRVRAGLKAIIFEQAAPVLEQRFGFRIAEYGLRNVFVRVPDHPILTGISAANLHDWTGEATLSTPRLQYTLKPMYGPMVKWCGMDLPHVWHCGCQGSVASVLIEKPARGDFLPLLDGGYSLQYSPLLEFHEGYGTMFFCQLDVTARTQRDPAADRIVANLIQYALKPNGPGKSPLLYAGDAAGLAHLRAAGFTPRLFDSPLEPATQSKNPRVLIQVESDPYKRYLLAIGPGWESHISAGTVGTWQVIGRPILAIGLDGAALQSVVSPEIRTRTSEHIATTFDPQPEFGGRSTTNPFVGIAPADVHIRDPRMLPLVESGAKPLGDGVLANAGTAFICQLVPWQFDPANSMNLKRTYRRSSFLLTRLLCNMGAECTSPVLDDAVKPLTSTDHRWLDGLYLDTPTDWDDPYRFFGW